MDWANIAEVVAAIVIVISLGYLGLKINQNTKTLQNEPHRRTLEMMNWGQNILATDEGFLRIYKPGLESLADPVETEWSRFVQFTPGHRQTDLARDCYTPESCRWAKLGLKIC